MLPAAIRKIPRAERSTMMHCMLEVSLMLSVSLSVSLYIFLSLAILRSVGTLPFVSGIISPSHSLTHSLTYPPLVCVRVIVRSSADLTA